MNTYNYLISLIIIVFFLSCSSPEKKVHATYNPEKGIISIELDNIESSDYVLSINNIELSKGSINNDYNFTILNKIKEKEDYLYDIALIAAKNGNDLDVSFKMPDLIDTTFVFHLTPILTNQKDKIQFSGIGAKVLPKTADRNVDEELKRWLYRSDVVLKDSLFLSFRNNYLYLTDKKSNEYVTKGEIPVLHQLAGCKYSVTGDIKADYYAVVACDNQGFINDFIENAVVDDYKHLSTSSSGLSLVCQDEKAGYLCVMFLGINKDYSYQQVPLALVGIDNVAPLDYEKGPESLSFKDDVSIIIPEDAPELTGCGYVQVKNWTGNGLECNVSFSILFFGDCKSVTIQRRGSLCYTESLGHIFRAEDKTFYAKDHLGGCDFNWMMHFEGGDNKIPVIVEDYHGNRAKHELSVRAEFVRNTPQINIDNTIYN